MSARTARSKADHRRRGPVADIATGFAAVFGAIQQIRHAKVMIPLLLYFILKLALLLLYVQSGDLHAVWALALWGGAAGGLGHYPQHLLLLPHVMSRFDIVLDVFVYVIAHGATILLVASFYRGERPGLAYGFGGSLKRYGHLVGVMLIITAAVAGAVGLASLPSHLGWVRQNNYISTGGGVILGLAVQAFFIFAVPSVLLSKRSVIGAVRESFRLAGRRYLLVATLAVIPFVVTTPTFLLGFKSQLIAIRLFPELMIYIQILGEVLHLIASYILAGSIAVQFIEEAGGKTVDRYA